MTLTVPDEVLALTTECDANFSCLETQKCGNLDMCKIARLSGPSLAVLESPDIRICTYRKTYGAASSCRCPTRCTIYQKYNI